MTIILALGNRQQVIQLSDRRISSNGRTVNDETNKCGVLFCPHARLAFGYTGLARYKSFDTIEWLVKAIHDSGPPSFLILDIIENLKANAEKTFSEHPALKNLRNELKKISIMFSGFLYTNGSPRQGYAILSNYVNLETGELYENTQDVFNVRYWSEIDSAGNPTLIQRIGNWHGIVDKDLYNFRQLLAERKPTKAVVSFAVEYLRDLADRKKSEGCIGKQLTSISIPADLNSPVETNYHSDVVQRGIFMPAEVYLFPNKHGYIANLSIRPVEADTPPMSVPVVNKNAFCPCGSKIRYKNCHGKKWKQKGPSLQDLLPRFEEEP